MATETLLRLQQSTYDHPQQFINDINDIVYPVLIEQANKLLSPIDEIRNDLYRQLSNHVVTEISAMFTQETEILFPLIEGCVPGDALSCDHFKITKLHYQNLLKACSELKFVLFGQEEMNGKTDHVIEFENLLILFQSTKNKYLFARFKNCKNCKLTVDVVSAV